MSQGHLPGRDWVEAASCAWVHEAQLLVSVLDAAGIRAMIPNEYVLGVQPLYGHLVGGVRVLVHPDDLLRAQEILDSPTNAAEAGDPMRGGPPPDPQGRG